MQFPCQNPEYELSQLDDEVILYSVKVEKAIYLNTTAQLIWSLCTGEHSIGDIIETLEQEFPEETEIEPQVLTAFEQLQSDGVVSINSEPN